MSMEFIAKTADLKRELGLVQGVVERKTTMPILANVLITAREGEKTGGEVEIRATDLEVGEQVQERHRLEGQQEVDVEAAPAATLFETLGVGRRVAAEREASVADVESATRSVVQQPERTLDTEDFRSFAVRSRRYVGRKKGGRVDRGDEEG